MKEYEPTTKQEQAIREYLHEAVIPLIEDVLVKKLGQAMSFCSKELKSAEAEKQKPVAIGGEWKPCVKLPIVVHVREQRKGETHVSTREGITPVKEDDLIMRGVAGEEYPIGRELFNRTYTFDTAPVHAIDISQKRVDETAKRKHEWVGFTSAERDEIVPMLVQSLINHDDKTMTVLLRAILIDVEAKLKEKNT
jgi:hypothetical protein